MLLQVSNPGSMNLFSLSLLWEIVFLSLIVVFVIYLIRHYNKSFLWAHLVIHPLQSSLHRWNHRLSDWLQHYKPVVFFQKANRQWNNFYSGGKNDSSTDSFAEEVISTVTRKRMGVFANEEYDLLLEENKDLQEEINKLKQQLKNKENRIYELLEDETAANQLQQELHTVKVYNSQLKLEVESLIQYREANGLLEEKADAIQKELNELGSKLNWSTYTNEQLNKDISRLDGAEKELVDAINYNKELEKQIERLLPLEEEIKFLEGEKNILLLQLQDIKIQKHHEYANLMASYESIMEERNQLRDTIVLLGREVGALTRSLNNNKQQLNEDALWENKFIIAAKELNNMRLHYASMENELSLLRNKEQILREKANFADGFQQELKLRIADIAALQRQLFDCRKKYIQ